jgi:hypothetical protein
LLAKKPLAVATAFTVVDELIVIGEEYSRVEPPALVFGVVPSNV